MSQRVKVAVPDALFDRLHSVKQNFNISAICQEALDMAITCEEMKVQVAEDSNLVERLRVEKKVLLKQVRQEGFELGIRSSSKLSCKDFVHFERVSPLAASLDEDVLEPVDLPSHEELFTPSTNPRFRSGSFVGSRSSKPGCFRPRFD
jgi:hypothetical protein